MSLRRNRLPGQKFVPAVSPQRASSLFSGHMAQIMTACILFGTAGCGTGQRNTPSSQASTQSTWMPLQGDLRFQGIGAYSFSGRYLGTAIFGGMVNKYPKYAGSPLQLGSGVCGKPYVPSACYWFFAVNGPPTFKTTAGYSSGNLENLGSALASAFSSGNVITSLDIQKTWDAYATAQVIPAADSPAYHGSVTLIPADALASKVNQLTSTGRVVTALAYDDTSGFEVVSTSWDGDSSSKFEAVIVASTIPDVAANFKALAAQGYIVSAVGGTRASGIQLVGVRQIGNTVPRPTYVLVIEPGTKGKGYDPLKEGFVQVGAIFDDSNLTNTVLYQK